MTISIDIDGTKVAPIGRKLIFVGKLDEQSFPRKTYQLLLDEYLLCIVDEPRGGRINVNTDPPLWHWYHEWPPIRSTTDP